MALLRPTCPIVYTVSPTCVIDAYAQPTRQHCWSRRHDALPLVIERFQLLRHAPGMPFLWLFVARQHCLRYAGSLRLIFIAVLLTNSSSGTVYRALSLSFSYNFCTVLPQRFFQCMGAPKSYSYLHYITSQGYDEEWHSGYVFVSIGRWSRSQCRYAICRLSTSQQHASDLSLTVVYLNSMAACATTIMLTCCCCCCHDEPVRHCLYGGTKRSRRNEEFRQILNPEGCVSPSW